MPVTFTEKLEPIGQYHTCTVAERIFNVPRGCYPIESVERWSWFQIFQLRISRVALWKAGMEGSDTCLSVAESSLTGVAYSDQGQTDSAWMNQQI